MTNVVGFKNLIERSEQRYDDVALTAKPRYDREWCLIHLFTRWIENKTTREYKRAYEWLYEAIFNKNAVERRIAMDQLIKFGFALSRSETLFLQEQQDKAQCITSGLYLYAEQNGIRRLNKHFACTEWQKSWKDLLVQFSELGSYPVILNREETFQRRNLNRHIYIPALIILGWFYPKQ